MYVNENGLVRDLPINKLASSLVLKNVRGNVLLFIENKKSMYYDLILDSVLN